MPSCTSTRASSRDSCIVSGPSSTPGKICRCVSIIFSYLVKAQRRPETYHHCTRWQRHLQVQHPLSTCLPLKQVLVMPTLCILRGRTRYRPYKGNCVDLTMGECEKASPHLMAEGFIRAARLPPILPL